MNRSCAFACFLLCCAPLAAAAQAVQGYLDFRAALPSTQQDWTDGGLAKTRFGGDSHAALGGAVLIDWQLAPAGVADGTPAILRDAR